MDKIIELKEWEIHIILKALGRLPYNEVAAIIQHIKDQAESGGTET